ncbi:GrpB family protein [Amycolatopsis rhabdoformis]|uniref:GrpB family protein n=1 Tax=Amycolatopsis rhabdoformis TaxID=1448059 RepID=A0ABZ1IA03_9PSEU|nr:GrpB family protein [Amycolatopsis rhabdoformis]WSE31250.1 GrpB family protein [Amycolatopsis rhabdoformis]
MDAPGWAYEKPRIAAADPAWSARGAGLCARLGEVLRPWLVEGVEHVGSTSVPGLAAKPVVDVMASVRDVDEVVAEAGSLLSSAGWAYVPPSLDVGAPYRRFFVLPDAAGEQRLAHLHVLPAGHPRWSAQLAFRDALRADPALAAEYAALKHRLTRETGDREAYTAGKTEFVTGVLSRHAEPPVE